MKVVIAGAGIGGLSLALSLHAAGIDCVVHEAVAELKPLGVGINLLPHAVRELFDMGLQDALSETAIPTAELAYYNKSGQRIWSEPRGLAAGYHWPQFSVHRGALQLILLVRHGVVPSVALVAPRLAGDSAVQPNLVESVARRQGSRRRQPAHDTFAAARGTGRPAG